MLLALYAWLPVKITSLSSQKRKGKSRTDPTAVTLVVTLLLICSYDQPFSPSFFPLHPPKPICNSQILLNTITGCCRSISPYLWPRVDLHKQWTCSWLPTVPLPAQASPMISNCSPGLTRAILLEASWKQKVINAGVTLGITNLQVKLPLKKIARWPLVASPTEGS